MTNFLIHRPIAVLMSFLALIIFSVMAIYELPVSLLPDTEVPQLTISVSYPDASPQEIEQNVLRPVRESFATLSGLKDVETQASYEYGTATFQFSYGTAMDLAYISANEKMDRLMALLPTDLERPQIIRTSASDIPIIKIQATPKKNIDKVALSNLVVNVIKKRIEQIQGVSLIDLNGLKTSIISIEPDQARLNALKLTHDNIILSIDQSNQPLGAVSVKDGQYRYYIKIKNVINDVNSIKSLAIRTEEGKAVRLDQIAKIEEKEAKSTGYHIYDQKEAIVLNVHKQASARIVDLIPLIKEQVALLNMDYDQVAFTTTQDQSTLLNLSINNLTGSLVIGGICAFVILFAFMSNARIPLIIGISLPSSLLLAFLLFWAFDVSINIVSLSGLALGLGMLIDNSIIVIDNITRKRIGGLPVMQSCVEGVSEVVSPLISSVLTTLAVFVPLIFLGGISGTLFYDQAISVAAILSVSLLVAFILLPVLYSLFFKNSGIPTKDDSKTFDLIKNRYKRLYQWVLAHDKLTLVFLALFTVMGLYLGNFLAVQGLPELEQKQKELIINWNEPITITENKKRVIDLLQSFSHSLSLAEADIGITQYLLQSAKDEVQQVRILMDVENYNVSKEVLSFLKQHFPNASTSFKDAPNAFEQLFVSNEPYLEARFRGSGDNEYIPTTFVEKATALLATDPLHGKGFEQQSMIELELDYGKINIYGMDQNIILEKLDQIFGRYKISEIKSFNKVTPIYFNPSQKNLLQSLKTTHIKSTDSTLYPLSYFVTPGYQTDLKYVLADQVGNYQGIQFPDSIDVSHVQKEMKDLAMHNSYLVSFTGQYFKNRENIARLILVLMISILLLYFILVAQFESFTQPLIIILTLPIGIAGSLFALTAAGATLNIMSGIGIIIMLGIIVNDSILKIDTINRFRTHGETLENSLLKAGSLRLKPILMTSITTILALLPMLFFSGLGASLQTPLVYAVTGGLTLGTFASIFIIPIFYKLLG